MKIAVPDFVTPFSGIGVIQKELYPRLEGRGFDVIPYLSRQPGSSAPLASATSALRALTQPVPRAADVLFALTSPYPLHARVPSVGVVHDLRWLRTRSALGRAYRSWDLRRTVTHSSVLVTVSQRSADDIRMRLPGAEPRVVYPGPGQYLSVTASPQTPDAGGKRDVLLIGAAPHKRNELAANVLARLPEDWFDTVRCVNASAETRALLTAGLGDARCEFHVNVSAEELTRLYRISRFSVQLSVEEGFGMPFIEALSAGCVVIAVDQPLTRELLGAAAVLVPDGGAQEIAEQLTELTSLPAEPDRSAQAARYSWDIFTDGIVSALEDAATGAGA